jgi:ABC-type antimicrobial peptide transport system permease subunit
VIASPAALDTVVEGDWYIVAAAAMGGVLLVGILLTLAASAIFALMSFAVTQRTREIGIRIALGADRKDIAFVIVRRALAQVGLGVLLGMPLAGRIFFETLEDRGAAHAGWSGALLAKILGVGILAAIALTACAAPTRRALRVMPTEALKAQ